MNILRRSLSLFRPLSLPFTPAAPRICRVRSIRLFYFSAGLPDSLDMADKKGKGGGKFDPKAFPEPAFFAARLQLWEEAKATQRSVEKKPIKVTLKDGKQLDAQAGETTPFLLAKGISQGLAKKAVVAKVNGKSWDLWRPLEEDCSLELFTFEDPEGKHAFWHSSAHILGQALELVYGASLCIGPPTEHGFYYDCALPDGKTISLDDLPTVSQAAQHVISQKQPFERLELTKEQALKIFAYNKYKTEIITQKVPEGDTITAYRCGPLIDLCRGPHVPDTGKITAFEVLRNSAAYWLGKAENDALQRVYAISFPSKKELAAHLHFLEEAKKRDHRRIGAAQELFMFNEKSAGCAFFLPHGARVYNKLMDLLKGEYRKRGYSEVISPNVFNSSLWETSGHWEHYKDDMFTFEVEGATYGLKPMNCPGHCLMFGNRVRSYRDLPLRFADFGVLHRNELSGALSGLTRVRRFQQDDCHIFCTKDQIRQELNHEIDFMKHVYGIFGYKFTLELSTRPEKYLGELEVWNAAEATLAEVLNERFGEGQWQLNPGDGAFYGPKIDIHIHDAIGRSHQCATIQLDFTLPERFKLEYVNDKNENVRPIIIHRAMYGSLERFIAILIEHTAGKWPFWLSPRQAIVLTISDGASAYARSVKDKIEAEGYYCDVDDSDKTINKKVRESQLAQYNFMLVVGDAESGSNTVCVRKRDEAKPVGTWTLEETLEKFSQMRKNFE